MHPLLGSSDSSIRTTTLFLISILTLIGFFSSSVNTSLAQSDGTINSDPQASYPPQGTVVPSDGLFLYDGQQLVQLSEIVQQTVDLGLVYNWGVQFITSFEGIAETPYSYPTIIMQSSTIQPSGLSLEMAVGGVGLRLGTANGQVVVSPYDSDLPAYLAGIGSGDILLQVNGIDVNGDATYATTLLTGMPGASVSATLIQGTRSYSVNMTRVTIDTQPLRFVVEPWDNNSVIVRPSESLAEGIYCYSYQSDDPNSFARYVHYLCFAVGNAPGFADNSVTVTGNDIVQQEIPEFAFSGGMDGNWDIYVVDEAGVVHQLTNNQGSNFSPKWSPDGQYIAFHSNRDATENPLEHFQIYVMRSDGSDVRRLTENGANEGIGSWSPDGQQLTFDSNRDGVSQIYVMNADGSNQHPLFLSMRPSVQPNWSPDGQLIAYSVVDLSGHWEIDALIISSVRHSEGGDEGIGSIWGASFRFSTQDMYEASSPQWSSDGSHVAFVTNKDGNNNIYLVNSDGTNGHPLTTDPGNDGQYGISWSPDGTEILYTVDGGINIVNVNTGLSRSTGINGINPAWKPQNPITGQCPYSSEEGWVWVSYARYNELLSWAQVQRDNFAQALTFGEWAIQAGWDVARERLTEAALIVLQLPRATPGSGDTLTDTR